MDTSSLAPPPTPLAQALPPIGTLPPATSQLNVSEECPDCGGSFPLRQGGGPCPKCLKLAPHHRNTVEYDDISVSRTICLFLS
jgi:hypothetical protein